MKKSLLFAGMVLLSIGLLGQVQKEVVTGGDYADDVYYSFENGTVTVVPRTNWDIGFTTGAFSISILANNGSGVDLYTYPSGDTADWATLDTTGMKWTPMYNSIESLDMGAFTRNDLGHPDYGWGTYSMNTHNTTGDSLFVIKTLTGDYKKLAIIHRGAMTNTWDFKYANLDGSDEQVLQISAGEYKASSFVYYNIENKEVLNREPATSSWDLLFTKYFDYNIPYSVTGVLSNEDHVVAQEVRESGMDQSTHNSFEESAFTSDISILGSDWKKFDMGAMAYVLNDTVVYYLKSYGETDSTYYKLYFTAFTGSSEGKYTFMQEKLSTVSAEDHKSIQLLEVYPNPASDNLNVVFDHMGKAEIDVIDMTGRVVQSTCYDAGGFTSMSVDVSSLISGLYFLQVNTGDESSVIRFIKE